MVRYLFVPIPFMYLLLGLGRNKHPKLTTLLWAGNCCWPWQGQLFLASNHIQNHGQTFLVLTSLANLLNGLGRNKHPIIALLRYALFGATA
jgi:hypothetical protein